MTCRSCTSPTQLRRPASAASGREGDHGWRGSGRGRGRARRAHGLRRQFRPGHGDADQRDHAEGGAADPGRRRPASDGDHAGRPDTLRREEDRARSPRSARAPAGPVARSGLARSHVRSCWRRAGGWRWCWTGERPGYADQHRLEAGWPADPGRTAISVDRRLGLAAVLDTYGGQLSLINLKSGHVIAPITVGSFPVPDRPVRVTGYCIRAALMQ